MNDRPDRLLPLVRYKCFCFLWAVHFPSFVVQETVHGLLIRELLPHMLCFYHANRLIGSDLYRTTGHDLQCQIRQLGVFLPFSNGKSIEIRIQG